MRIPSILILFLFSGIVNISAQTKTDSSRRIRISDAFISGSVIIQSNPWGTIEDFRNLAPESEILKKDFRSYSNQKFINIDANGAFALKTGISFFNRDGSAYLLHPMLRAGVMYKKSTGLFLHLSKKTTSPYDTLISSQGGAPSYLDSVTDYSVGMTYQYEELRADISIIFSAREDARLAFFSGIGVNVGSTFNAFTSVNENTSRYVQFRTDDETSSAVGHSENHNKDEHFRNGGSLSYCLYIPVIVDFRIGRKREFWKRLHVFYEAKPFFNSLTIPELRTMSNVGFESCFGARVSF